MPLIRCPLKIAAERFGDEVAIIDGDYSITWHGLDRLTDHIAGQLKEQGLSDNPRVAIVSRNRREQVSLILACLRIKSVAVLLSDRLPKTALMAQANTAGCTHQVIMLGSTVATVLPDIAVIKINFDALAPAAASGPDLSIDTKQPATILFTSGSSANAKAVLHSFGNHYYNALGSNKNIPVEPRDRWLMSLPLYHVGGLGILFRSLLGGGTMVFAGPDDSIDDAVGDHSISHLSLVATQLKQLLDDSETSCLEIRLKAILLGGGPTAESLIKRAQQLDWPVYHTYGLTEMTSQVGTGSTLYVRHLSILENRQLMISSDGEIMVKGETLFLGYVDRNKISRTLDADGWFATGDCGCLDEKDRLIITGRRDNMFISGGENIHPEQIEAALGQLPQIARCMVVPVDDSKYGSRPAAFLRFTSSVIEDELQIDHERLINHLERLLPRFMLPVVFYPWPTDYETDGLKSDRRFFRELAGKLYKRT